MDATPLSEEDLTDVYNWIDQLPLSRPKKNITRDFSDGGNNLIYHSSDGRSDSALLPKTCGDSQLHCLILG